MILSRLEVIRSPLLPSSVLRDYNEAIPGLADKLVEWTKEETEHRRKFELQVLEEEKTLKSRGQAFGLAATLFGLAISGAVGIAAAVYGSFAAMSVAIVVAIVSVGGPFAARVLANKWSPERQNDDGTR